MEAKKRQYGVWQSPTKERNMATFESKLGSKEVEGGSFRNFSVPDETEGSGMAPSFEVQNPEAFDPAPDMERLNRLKELENQVSEARKAKLEGKISPEAKKRIELLTGIGQATKDVAIGENVFTLRTLAGDEQRALSLIGFNLAHNPRGDLQFEIRAQILARAVCAIDGQSFSNIVGSDDVDIHMMAIEKLDDTVLRLLIQNYNELSNENNKKFGIKTDEDVKEVVEDIKKA